MQLNSLVPFFDVRFVTLEFRVVDLVPTRSIHPLNHAAVKRVLHCSHERIECQVQDLDAIFALAAWLTLHETKIIAASLEVKSDLKLAGQKAMD